jgi:hypothetical protein
MTDSQESSYTRKTFNGLYIMSDTDPQTLAFILVGKYEEELKCAMHMGAFKKIATSPEDLEKPEVLSMYSRLVEGIRSYIQGIITQELKMMKQEQMESVKRELAQSNKPHALGTVAEISTKYGISKSEVRRMKADGTLEAWVATRS